MKDGGDDDEEEDGGDDDDEEEEGYQGVGTRIVVRSQTAIESKTQFVGDCIPGLIMMMITTLMTMTMVLIMMMIIINMVYS